MSEAELLALFGQVQQLVAVRPGANLMPEEPTPPDRPAECPTCGLPALCEHGTCLMCGPCKACDA